MKTYPERTKQFLEDYDKISKKNKITIRPVILFANKSKTPFYAKWAWKVILKAGGKLDLEFIDVAKK